MTLTTTTTPTRLAHEAPSSPSAVKSDITPVAVGASRLPMSVKPMATAMIVITTALTDSPDELAMNIELITIVYKC